VATTATHSPPEDAPGNLPVYVFAAAVLAGLIGAAFAIGWVFGRILL
jgi:hypothetical protein